MARWSPMFTDWLYMRIMVIEFPHEAADLYNQQNKAYLEKRNFISNRVITKLKNLDS
jgi:hypothetical protein